MLLSKIKEIKNGRVIVKDSKAKDAVGGLYNNFQEWQQAAKQRGYTVRQSVHPSGSGIQYNAKTSEGNERGAFDPVTNKGTLDSKMKDAVRPGTVEVGKTLIWHGREGDVVSVQGDKIVLDIDGEKYTVNARECENGTTGDSKTKDKLFDLGNYKGVRIYEGTENKTDKFFTYGEGHGANIGYLAGYTLNELKSKIDAAAKSLSVAQGKAASDAKTKDVGVKYVGTYKGIKIDKTNEGRFLAYINYDPVLKNSLQEMKDYIDKKASK